jgi:hypothetical protein
VKASQPPPPPLPSLPQVTDASELVAPARMQSMQAGGPPSQAWTVQLIALQLAATGRLPPAPAPDGVAALADRAATWLPPSNALHSILRTMRPPPSNASTNATQLASDTGLDATASGWGLCLTSACLREAADCLAHHPLSCLQSEGGRWGRGEGGGAGAGGGPHAPPPPPPPTPIVLFAGVVPASLPAVPITLQLLAVVTWAVPVVCGAVGLLAVCAAARAAKPETQRCGFGCLAGCIATLAPVHLVVSAVLLAVGLVAADAQAHGGRWLMDTSGAMEAELCRAVGGSATPGQTTGVNCTWPLPPAAGVNMSLYLPMHPLLHHAVSSWGGRNACAESPLLAHAVATSTADAIGVWSSAGFAAASVANATSPGNGTAALHGLSLASRQFGLAVASQGPLACAGVPTAVRHLTLAAAPLVNGWLW